MTDPADTTPTSWSLRADCRHSLIERHRNAEHDLSMWACADCKRRFYPACEQCISACHRSGHGEHVRAALAAPQPDEALRAALVDSAKVNREWFRMVANYDEDKIDWDGWAADVASRFAALAAKEEG